MCRDGAEGIVCFLGRYRWATDFQAISNLVYTPPNHSTATETPRISNEVCSVVLWYAVSWWCPLRWCNDL